MSLHCERHGRDHGNGPRWVLLHGFGQTARCWGAVADDLARDHEVICVDAPGHGGSATVRADLPTTADLVVEAAGAGAYLGYSMGARMALHAALRWPRQVTTLVLVGGTAGIEDDGERAARRERDLLTAARVRTDGVEAFFERWFDQPLFATLPRQARFLAERRRNPAEGLAASLELAGTGSQAPLWDELPRLDVPVLVVAGALDERYAALAERMATAIGPNATAAVIPGAGHAAHLEQPDLFLATLHGWAAAR